MKFSSIFLVFIVQLSYSQDLTLIKLTNEETINNVQYHYQWESTEGHVAVIDLLLLKDHAFEYSIGSNIYNAYSTGHWQLSKGVLTLNSDFQKGTLPIKISYRQRDGSDLEVKKIAFVKDLNNKPISYAFVYINNDSTSCMDGDMLCIGDFEDIDSIKVVLENNGPSSKWMPVTQHEELLQITILTRHSLENYIILTDKKYRLDKNILKPLKTD